MATVDQIFEWMRSRRVPPKGCSRCGLEQLTYFRDVNEQPIGFCCVTRAWYDAEVAHTAARKRLRTLGHDCPAEGCVTCSEAGA